MYDPIGNAIERTAKGVRFTEYLPPAHLRTVVHRYLHIRTDTPLPTPHRFHALPDACTYLIFDQHHPKICGITRLRASSEELTLGHSFHNSTSACCPVSGAATAPRWPMASSTRPTTAPYLSQRSMPL